MRREKISKDRIIDAFLSESFLKSASGVSLADLAESLGIKKASLYNYFRNREAIVQATVESCGNFLDSLQISRKDDALSFAVSVFGIVGDRKSLEVLSFVEAEKFFNEKAFQFSQKFKIRMMNAVFPVLGAKTEFFVSALCALLNDFICAKKMAGDAGEEIEFDREKLKSLIESCV